MSGPHVVTLGCRLNAFESQIVRETATGLDLDDAVVVNTCAVTSEAVRQARQTIRKLRRERPGARIVVTGCAAQLDAPAFAAMPEVDRVLGNAEKLRAEPLASDAPIVVSDIMAVHDTAPHLVAGFEGRTRAFVQVQQGCDHRCTFCIIPFARGPNRSVSPDRVVDQVRALVANGYAEVVLTGVDVCSYGADLADRPTLGALARRILDGVPELRRLRLTSLDPAAIDDDLYALLADEPRMMPHWHLSLQAGDDTVLKRMKRRHSMGDVRAVVERARRARPDVVFGADLIAGFPTESEAMFANTLASVDGLGLTYLHVFPYSPRTGTPAARMPQVPGPVRKARAAVLRDAGETAQRRVFASWVGTATDVLVETDRHGRSEHFAPVRLAVDAPAGAVVAARVTAAGTDHLVAEPVS